MSLFNPKDMRIQTMGQIENKSVALAITIDLEFFERGYRTLNFNAHPASNEIHIRFQVDKY